MTYKTLGKTITSDLDVVFSGDLAGKSDNMLVVCMKEPSVINMGKSLETIWLTSSCWFFLIRIRLDSDDMIL